jgi:hypothetical protein
MLAGVRADIKATNVLVSAPEQQTGPYDAVHSMPPMGSHPPPQLHIEGSGRFGFGAPSRNADWLCAQHALPILAPEGVAVLLVARGPLLRAGSEGDVRRGLIDANFVDAVGGLPPGMVSTAIPAALLVLRRTRALARRGKCSLSKSLLGHAPRTGGRICRTTSSRSWRGWSTTTRRAKRPSERAQSILRAAALYRTPHHPGDSEGPLRRPVERGHGA